MRKDVLGVGFDDLTMEEAVDRAAELIECRKGAYVVTPNPEIVWMCRRDSRLREAVAQAEMVLPDGVGVLYGAKLLGRPLKEKIAGIDFAEKLLEWLAQKGKSAFFFGARPGVAEQAARRAAQRFPGLRVAGTADGYFSDDSVIVRRINEAKPDFLLVCLGAPKQELWMAAHRGELDVGLMAGLGGTLDVFAGVAERAPLKWRKANLEWLFRLVKQPHRIFRMARLPLFLAAVVFQRVKGR